MMSAQAKKRIDWKSVDCASESPNQDYYCPVPFATRKDLEARGDAENMLRQSMGGTYILIPSLILEKSRTNTSQYGQQ